GLGTNEPLAALKARLAEAGFDQGTELPSAEAGEACAIVWGRYMGVETPRLFLLALPEGAWDRANIQTVQERMWAAAPHRTPTPARRSESAAAGSTGRSSTSRPPPTRSTSSRS